MEIHLESNDIASYGNTAFNEKVAILSHESRYFRKFSEFIKNNTNFLGSRIGLMDVQYIVENPEASEDDPTPDFLILKLGGGKNGPGVWTEYLDHIHTLFVNLSRSYDVWMVGMENDCADDVFYMTVCVR